MRWIWVAIWMGVAGMVAQPGAAAEMPEGMGQAQVVFLGEVHDNPDAHARQAALVATLAPKALVFEMLTPEMAGRVTPDLRGDAGALAAALGWKEAGWPDFNMYYPIFAAAPGARVFGAAVPREAARAAMKTGVVESFGPEAAAYGLAKPLPKEQQVAREAFQFEAHCDALPRDMLPMMVELQRLRDATLARATKAALEATGGPVAVITGNGHARRDWGAPVYLERVTDAAIFALGISEVEERAGAFDALEIVPEAEREDPCTAFRKG